MSIESVLPSNHLILCCPFLLPLSIFLSIRVFSNESVLCIRWPKYWSFSFSISPSNKYSGLISFRMDWLDLLQSKGLSRLFSNTTVQEHHFFSAQPSLWFSSHIHTWLLEKPRLWQYGSWLAKWCLCFLIHYVRHSFSFKEQASFNFMAAVTICSDFGAHKNKVSHCFHFFPCICHEVIGPDAMILVFLNVEF